MIWRPKLKKRILTLKFWKDEKPWMAIKPPYRLRVDYKDQTDLIDHLIERTNHRDQLFKDIESAVLGNNHHEALRLARLGWGLRGR